MKLPGVRWLQGPIIQIQGLQAALAVVGCRQPEALAVAVERHNNNLLRTTQAISTKYTPTPPLTAASLQPHVFGGEVYHALLWWKEVY